MRKKSEHGGRSQVGREDRDEDGSRGVIGTPDVLAGLAEVRQTRLGGLASRMSLRELILEQSLREKTAQLQELLARFGQNVEFSKRVEELESERTQLMERLNDLSVTLSRTEEVELALRGELDRLDKEIEEERQSANQQILRLEEEVYMMQDMLAQEKQASYDYMTQVQESDSNLAQLTTEYTSKLRESKITLNERELLISDLELSLSHCREELRAALIDAKKQSEMNQALKYEKEKLEREMNEVHSDKLTIILERNRYSLAYEDVSKEIEHLRSENEDLKEELKNVVVGYEEYITSLQNDHNLIVEELQTKNRLLNSRLDGMREHQARSVQGFDPIKGHTPTVSQYNPNFLIEDGAALEKDDDSDIDRSVEGPSLPGRFNPARREDGRVKAWEYGDRFELDTQSVDHKDPPRTLSRVPTPKKLRLAHSKNGNGLPQGLPPLPVPAKRGARLLDSEDLSVDRYGLPRIDKTLPPKSGLALELRKIFKSATDLHEVALPSLIIQPTSRSFSSATSSQSSTRSKAVFPPKPGFRTPGSQETHLVGLPGQSPPLKTQEWGVYDFSNKGSSFFKLFSLPQFVNLAMYVTFL